MNIEDLLQEIEKTIREFRETNDGDCLDHMKSLIDQIENKL